MAQEPAQTPVPLLPLLIRHPWNRYQVDRYHVRADRLEDVLVIAAALKRRIATPELN